MEQNQWIAQLAAGACHAGRFLGLAAVLHSLLAIGVLVASHPALPAASLIWAGTSLASVPALYVAVRIEIDRGVFIRLSCRTEARTGALTALDSALLAIGLAKARAAERSLEERARGVFRLLGTLGLIVTLQILLSVSAALIGS